MSKDLNPPQPEFDKTEETSVAAPAGTLTSDAMARRHMLIKSLGKGSAVVAATSIHTLAGAGSLTFTASGSRCTISGTISGVHSKDTTKGTCAGNSPSHYSACSKWPGYNSSTKDATNTCGNVTFTQKSSFKDVFKSGSTSPNLLGIVTSAPTSDEAIWITALLNSISGSGATNFPYSSAKVLSLYQQSNAIDKAAALKFFKDYMQTIA